MHLGAGWVGFGLGFSYDDVVRGTDLWGLVGTQNIQAVWQQEVEF